jgi:soluble lytic murein transglycosylase
MKFNLRHVVAFLLLIALSVGFGFGFDAVCTAIEKSNHPQPENMRATIQKSARDFGVPEAVIYATVKCGSDFASNAVSEDGRIGLMQISPDRFTFICTEILSETPDTRTLYEPETNLRAGCAWISYLYGRYGVWEQVFAAYFAGTEQVDAWLQDPALVSEQGVLQKIPNEAVSSFVKDMTDAVECYTKLYY